MLSLLDSEDLINLNNNCFLSVMEKGCSLSFVFDFFVRPRSRGLPQMLRPASELLQVRMVQDALHRVSRSRLFLVLRRKSYLNKHKYNVTCRTLFSLYSWDKDDQREKDEGFYKSWGFCDDSTALRRDYANEQHLLYEVETTLVPQVQSQAQWLAEQ